MNIKQIIPYPPNSADESNPKDTKAIQDLVLITLIAIIVFILADVFKVFHLLVILSEKYGDTQVDKIIVVLMMLGVAFGIFSWRRWQDLNDEVGLHLQSELKLHEQEEKLKAQYQGVPIPTYTWEKQGDNFVLIDYNKAAEQITQGKIVSFFGKTLQEMYHNQSEIIADFQKCFTEKTIIVKEMPYQLQSTGENKYFNIRYVYIPDDIIMVHTEDITVRKQHEEALRDSETRFRTMIENVNFGVYRCTGDAEGQFIHANPTIASVHGYDSVDDFMQRTIVSFYENPDERKQYMEELKKNRMIKNREVRLMKKDGTFFWGAVTAKAHFAPDGSIEWIDGVLEDITQRKLLDKEVYRLQVFLDSIVENIPSMVFVKDIENLDYIRINRAGEELLGYSRKEILGKNAFDLFPQEEAAVYYVQDREVFESKKIMSIPEERVETKYRGSRILQTKKVPIFDELGKPCYILGISEDITDRKMAEDKLKQSEATLRALLNATTETIFLLNNQGTILTMNEIAASRLGKSVEELIGKNIYDILPSETMNHRKQFGEIILHSRQPVRFEDKRNGIWFDSYLYPMLDATGNVEKVAIFARDITAQKQAIQRIRQSEETIRAMINATTETIFLIDNESRVLAMNENTAKRFNRPINEIIGHNLYEFLPVEIATSRKKYIDTAFRTGTPVFFEDERNNIHFETNVYPILNAEGKTERVAIFARDITVQKRAQKVQQCLMELGEKLGAALAPKEAAMATLNAADELFGWDAAAIVIHSEKEGEEFTITAFDLVDGKRIEFPHGIGKSMITPIFKKTIQEGSQLILRNIDENNQDRKLIPFGDTGKKSASLMFVPIKKENKNIGMLTIQSYRPQAYDMRDLALLETIVNYGSGALERTITKAKLQQSEERYRQLIQFSPYPTAVIRNRQIVLVNNIGLETFGAEKPEQLIGKSIFEFVIPEYQAMVTERLQLIMEERNATPLAEIKLKRLNGTVFDAELASYAITVEDEPDILVIGRDITAQRIAERKILEYQEQLRKLNIK